ncbi:MAG: Cell division protein FtsX [Oscillospiraceae bacterium]|nr:Cell division protein FtsX [Oscillospiraceae bacterium]
MKRFNGGYLITEGLTAIVSHGLMSFVAICIIVACLIIMGSFSLVAVNINYNLGLLEDKNEFLAYIDESLDDDVARGLQSDIEAVDNVRSVTFISRTEAKESYIADKEDSALYEDLPDTVFRNRFSVQVDDIEQMETTIDQVEQVSGIVKVSADLEVAQGFVVARNVLSGISLIMVVVLSIVSVFIVYNTIRLATFHRREEIAIMKMCGATNGFVCWPFVIEGLVIGLAGGLIAFALQWAIYELIGKAAESPAASFQFLSLVPFGTMAWSVLGVFCLAGFSIGVGGSLLSIRKFLNV